MNILKVIRVSNIISNRREIRRNKEIRLGAKRLSAIRATTEEKQSGEAYQVKKNRSKSPVTNTHPNSEEVTNSDIK